MTAEPLDWEAAMTTTRESAEKAALHAERALGGVAQVLDHQRRLSLLLTDLTKTQAKTELRLSDLLGRSQTPPPSPSHRPQEQSRAPLWLLLSLSSALSALVASAVSLWS